MNCANQYLNEQKTHTFIYAIWQIREKKRNENKNIETILKAKAKF